jgi:FAD/FMN-containing dehydrogenase
MHVVLNAFKDLLGTKGFCDDLQEMQPWLTDWRGRYTGKAAALLSPNSTEQVAEIVKIAATHRIAIVPQGGNSGMVAGATPDTSGNAVIVSLRRMNKLYPLNRDDGLIVCEAGVILQNLHETVAASAMRFPLTLGGKGSATIGGLISTNAGGTQVMRHGTMRALVAGIQAVLPDGSIYQGLAPLKKDNRGYDLKHLLIGAEGTIGIVTGAVLQTVPALIDRCVVWAGVSSAEDAYQLLLYMQKETEGRLEGFEILPHAALENVITHIEGTRAPLDTPHNWHVLMELVQDQTRQSTPADLAVHLMGEVLERGLAQDAVLASSEAQAEAFWKIRDSIAEAERAEGPALQHDISVPVNQMARFIAEETPIIETKFPGTKVIAFGHLGDGNIHYHVKAPPGSEAKSWYEQQTKAIGGHVYDRVEAYHGSLSAEHGIGQLKRDELARLADPARLTALRAIKSAFDPLNIMNPGKLVPLA